MKRFAAVIPAYNEVRRVGDVIRASLPHVDVVLVVDDGSSDGTVEAAREAGAEVVVHAVNMGKGRAMETGIKWALEHGLEAIVMLDADGQHLGEEIPRFLDCYRKSGADIVLGTRMGKRDGMPFVRAMTNFVTSVVVSCAAGARITDSQSGFRLLKCATACRLPLGGGRFDAEPEMLVKAARAGLVIREVVVSTVYGNEESKINPFLDTVRFITMMLRLIFVER